MKAILLEFTMSFIMWILGPKVWLIEQICNPRRYHTIASILRIGLNVKLTKYLI